jgi:hypothetical protein
MPNAAPMLHRYRATREPQSKLKTKIGPQPRRGGPISFLDRA